MQGFKYSRTTRGTSMRWLLCYPLFKGKEIEPQRDLDHEASKWKS